MTIINGERITTQWYQQNALRTLNNFKDQETLRLNAYMGVIGEYGEFFDFIKKLYTHNLKPEKIEEVCDLAPKELGDVVWYLATSLAVYYGYSMDEVYDQFTHGVAREEDGYDIDSIYDYVKDDFQKDNIFGEMMRFKAFLNMLDTAGTKDEVLRIVSAIMLEIARVAKGLFGRELSDILYLNIDKLRKRYPEGFSTVVSNTRISVQSVYKREESLAVVKEEPAEDLSRTRSVNQPN